jgi:hypothetical protein
VILALQRKRASVTFADAAGATELPPEAPAISATQELAITKLHPESRQMEAEDSRVRAAPCAPRPLGQLVD